MKIYFMSALWLLTLTSIYGLIVPFLISYPDDILVLVGVVLTVVTIPLYCLSGYIIFKRIKEKLVV